MKSCGREESKVTEKEFSYRQASFKICKNSCIKQFRSLILYSEYGTILIDIFIEKCGRQQSNMQKRGSV